MTIVFTPDNFYLGLWWVGHNDATPVEDRVDWLCGAWRPVQGGAWTLHYRFRYHNSPDPFEEDVKHWYTAIVKPEAPPAQVVRAVQLIQQACVARWQGHPDCLMLRCTGDKAIQKLRTARNDWLHLRQEPL